MKKRIFYSILLTSVLTLLLAFGLSTMLLHNAFTIDTRHELIAATNYVARAVTQNPTYLDGLSANDLHRVTLVAPDGTVQYDSKAAVGSMNNHSDREEIVSALATGVGDGSRLSATLNRQTHYRAVRLHDGTVLRLSVITDSVFGAMFNILPGMGLTLFITLVVAYLLARRLADSILEPIDAINPENPLSTVAYDELAPLLTRMDRQNKHLADQVTLLRTRQKELGTITAQMSEALLVLGKNRKVLYVNPSAMALFSECKELVGTSYIAVSRQGVWIETVEAALEGRPGEVIFSHKGRSYRLSASPVGKEERFAVLLLLVDVTEKENAETMRREFSANVSHELKTPLTSIMGYAEIMEQGIAKPEDLRQFAGRIRTESERLLHLIKDIIVLSQLDEQDLRSRFESVDLADVCRSVLDELSGKAARRGVILHLVAPEAGDFRIPGLPAAVREMIFNICDNAVIYNIDNGRVDVTLSRSVSTLRLAVADTGIGIDDTHRQRVFERFYRVDKSRAKTEAIPAGSGLGLAIVKHAALLHGATIELMSNPGKGTNVVLSWNL